MSTVFSENPISQTKMLGDSVVMTCMIESLPAADIHWLLNDQFFKDGTFTTGGNGEIYIYHIQLTCTILVQLFIDNLKDFVHLFFLYSMKDTPTKMKNHFYKFNTQSYQMACTNSLFKDVMVRCIQLSKIKLDRC